MIDLFDRKFKVAVGVCAHRNITLATFQSLWKLKDCPNPEIHILPLDQDALISRSRSLVATHFLDKTDDDILMFIDDDIRISTYDATKLMRECFEGKFDILGAAYVTKSKKNPGLAIEPAENIDRINFGKSGAIYEVNNVSTGCMAIRREVLRKMVETETAPLCRHGGIGGGTKYYAFFQHKAEVINGQWRDLSEDWWFTTRARGLGFKCWIDTTIKLSHIGQYEYDWDDLINKEHRKEFDDLTVNVKREGADRFSSGSVKDGEAALPAAMVAKGETNGQ